MPSVFLSHSSKDKEFVRELYRRLTRDGVDCFFDAESIGWGDNWVRSLERDSFFHTLKLSRLTLVCSRISWGPCWVALENIIAILVDTVWLEGMPRRPWKRLGRHLSPGIPGLQ